LSFRQARACEQGITARCRCRCRGALHGARRFGSTPTFNDFRGLPVGDPHRVNQRRVEMTIVDARTMRRYVLAELS
jgi:hypothetical protein